MIEIEAWAVAAGGLFVTVAGAVNLGGLLRARLRERARVELERERSARNLARIAGLAPLVRQSRATVRLVEQDDDGRRLVEIVQPGPDRTEEAA